jgi:hypothetical protein
MALITSSVTSQLAFDITLPVPGYDAKHVPVVIPASGTVNLLGALLTPDQLEAIQPLLALLVSHGSLTVAGTVDTSTFTA